VDWTHRIDGIRQWSKNGTRAPHKPLLLLYALGRFQHDGGAPIRFADARADLDRLLSEFGPPNPTSAGYPFHHLTTDGVWEVRTRDGGASPGPNVGDLIARDAAGQLTADLAGALAGDSPLLAHIARLLLDKNFPASLHADICAAVGLDLEVAETAGTAQTAEGVRTTKESRARSAQFRKDVLLAYEYQCAFCGYDGLLVGSPVGLDAAHVRWWAFQGPDDVTNGVCLCALHHKLFDKGVLGVGDDHRIAVAAGFVGRSAAAGRQVLDLVDRPLLPPQGGFPLPDAGHLRWHREQVFRGPMRRIRG
jgi:putative restriction endonuclease